MSKEKPENRQAIEKAMALSMARTLALEGPFALQPSDPRLRLGQLASRRTIADNTTSYGDRNDVQITVESVGTNCVKHITNILCSATRTERVRQSILTVHTQVFSSLRDTLPALTDVRTIVLDHVEVTARVHEFLTTVVDKDGVHRFPVERAEILF